MKGCGRILGFGESCVAGYLCQQCTEIESLRAQLAELDGQIDTAHRVYGDEIKHLRAQLAERDERIDDLKSGLFAANWRWHEIRTALEAAEQARDGPCPYCHHDWLELEEQLSARNDDVTRLNHCIREGLKYRDELRSQLSAAEQLLRIAKCPNNCHKGTIPHGPTARGDYEAEQCQWCYERDAALPEVKQ